MSMHRYKYAIGQAPVRFPAAKQEADGNAGATRNKHSIDSHGKAPAKSSSFSSKSKYTAKTTEIKYNQQHHSAAKSLDVGPSKTLRHSTSAQELKREALNQARDADSSTITASRSSNALLTTETNIERASSPASRWSLTWSRSRQNSASSTKTMGANGEVLDVQTSTQGSHSPAPSKRSQPFATRQSSSPLAREARILQRADASTPLLRPNSHFWTDLNNASSDAKDEEERKLGAGRDAGARCGRSLTQSSSRYGATSDKRAESRTRQSTHFGNAQPHAPTDADDPYGYRALAGPSLLPAFYEQRQKEERARQRRNGCMPAASGIFAAEPHWHWQVLTFCLALVTLSALYISGLYF